MRYKQRWEHFKASIWNYHEHTYIRKSTYEIAKFPVRVFFHGRCAILHWRPVSNRSNRCNPSLYKVCSITRVQYDRDDRGLRNLAPATSMNRIVLSLSRKNKIFSDVVNRWDSATVYTHSITRPDILCVFNFKQIIFIFTNIALYTKTSM